MLILKADIVKFLLRKSIKHSMADERRSKHLEREEIKRLICKLPIFVLNVGACAGWQSPWRGRGFGHRPRDLSEFLVKWKSKREMRGGRGGMKNQISIVSNSFT